jgi:hypothetical protein
MVRSATELYVLSGIAAPETARQLMESILGRLGGDGGPTAESLD